MVSNMEKHYVFKSLFEDTSNITRVSSIGGKAHLCTLSDTVHSAHIFRCSYSSRATRRLLVDNGCSSPKTRCVTVAESLFLKNFSTANVRSSSDQRCMMAEGFKPLYPAMCVSPRHLQKCRRGAKFKSSYCF